MHVEIKYLNLLSSRLDKFKQKKPYLWNFRCFYCGDSQRNKNKARGFVFQLKGELLYKCHNCGVSVPFPKMLQDLDMGLYKEYRMEKFQSPKRVDMRKVKRVVSSKPVFTKNILADITPLDNLNNSHPAKEYILQRKLPTEALYYTEKFKEWTNSVKPNTFPNTEEDEGRIIIPFRDKEGNVFGYQGRSLHSTGLRYITVLLDEGQPKIFGLNTINYEKPIYITEGPFDSLLLPNAAAMAGADASTNVLGDAVCVYVYDNEPRNREITKRIEKHISNGDSVVIFPSSIKEKDINDMHLAGHNVQDLVTSNTYKGLNATLKFNDWKK
jgi:hypothetical protein